MFEMPLGMKEDVGEWGLADEKVHEDSDVSVLFIQVFHLFFSAHLSGRPVKVHIVGTLLTHGCDHDFMIVSQPLGGGSATPALQNMFFGHGHLPTNSIGPFSFSWLCQDGKMFVKHHEKPKRRLIASWPITSGRLVQVEELLLRALNGYEAGSSTTLIGGFSWRYINRSKV